MRPPIEVDWVMLEHGHFAAARTARGWMWVALCLAVIGARPVRADSVLPAAYPADRYQKMSGHSPFAPPTAAAPVVQQAVAPTGSWSDKLAVTLLMQQGGTYIATVLDRDTSQHFLVSSAEKRNERDMMLSSVQWGNQISQTRVTIRKGTEFGQVSFDPSATASAAPAAGPPIPGAGPRPVNPGAILFHPPAASNAGFTANRPSSSVIRRGPIQAAPPNVNTSLRAVPAESLAKSMSNDDDDDDDN